MFFVLLFNLQKKKATAFVIKFWTIALHKFDQTNTEKYYFITVMLTSISNPTAI